MEIVAWKCETTGKVFEHKVKYQSHLKKLAADRRSKAKHDAFEAARKQIFNDMRNTVRCKSELIAFITKNWQHFCMNAMVNSWSSTRRTKNKIHPNLKFFSVKDFRWVDHVSNSHRAPIGKATNWGGRDKNKPTGYPGWMMAIEYNVEGPDTVIPYSSEAWDHTGINTGTGGYARNYYFAVELFAEDWPAMADAYEKAKAWAILNNDKRKINEIVETMYSTA